MRTKGVVIAGTHSGCGKTTVTLALMAALIRRGLQVAPFKVGPDFIDPGHHSRITGRTSLNLDGWMLSHEDNRRKFFRAARDVDIAVVEGVMGLFDGYDGKSESGSTAQMAKWLDLPVLLVVSAQHMARSAAAVVQGFENFDPGLSFTGVLFNRVGSDRHRQYLRESLQGNVRIPFLGAMPIEPQVSIPERHLGLVTREDHPLAEASMNRLADMLETHMDIGALLRFLPEIRHPEALISHTSVTLSDFSPRIGVARDNAFCFYYPENISLLEDFGARIVYFSPISDRQLPEPLHGLYFGGGYPELFARRLADNVSLRREIYQLSREGMPVYGECGGFMFLCRELQDLDGETFPMAGCFPFTTRMFSRLRSLGYREVTLSRDTIIGQTGLTLRGHEFHYSEISEFDPKIVTTYAVSTRTGVPERSEGYLVNQTLGSYCHLHFGSRPEAAHAFVASCDAYRQQKETIR
jgi:cobyrinic acid a,c-diamide synthase